MIFFRLSKSVYAQDLSGSGSQKAGGRWNSKGTAIIYTSSSRALCTAELAVHLPLGIVPDKYCIVEIEIPKGTKISEIKPSELPLDWNSIPPTFSTQLIGDAFVKENKFLILKVPSVVVPGDFNFLINPNHRDSKKIKIRSINPFQFDKRLFTK